MKYNQAKLTAGAVYDELKDRLQLQWLSGVADKRYQFSSPEVQSTKLSLVGFLNLIHPNKIQLIGEDELKYLDSLNSRHRWSTLAEILSHEPFMLIVCDSMTVPEDLAEGAKESQTTIISSTNSGEDLLSYLEFYLKKVLAPQTTLHGVFMEILSVGVLLMGDSGAGKSELALELLTRGHRLIADDAPEFTLIAPDILSGACPGILQDLLEVRGLGVLNVRDMFGDSAIKTNKYLKLIIHLSLVQNSTKLVNRLEGDFSQKNVLGLDVTVIRIPVAPGRNLAVIAEAAVRNHILKSKGYDATKFFVERQRQSILNNENDH